jgi:large conductance mechanosensitive channel
MTCAGRSALDQGAAVLKGFKDFLMRGNVVELAVAVVIGVAFTGLVTAFTDNIINPFIAALGGANVNGLAFQLIDGNPESVVNIGAVLSAAINFAIIAAVVYFLFVLPFEKLKELRRRGEETGPAEPTDVELLAEIRDLLRAQQRP